MADRICAVFSRWRVALLAAGIAFVAPAAADEHEFGRALAEINCAMCHAIGVEDESAHDEAPAFRALLRRYPVDALEEAFAHSIVTGHPDMPEFEGTPEQIGALIGYIESIQR